MAQHEEIIDCCRDRSQQFPQTQWTVVFTAARSDGIGNDAALETFAAPIGFLQSTYAAISKGGRIDLSMVQTRPFHPR